MRGIDVSDVRWKNPLRRGLRAAAVMLFFSLSACGGNSADQVDLTPDKPAEQLYAEAQEFSQNGQWLQAAAAYEEVERQHPYSELAKRAQVEAAYAYYEGDSYEEAVGAAERFIDLHPGDEATPYAYYLIGLCYYEQISDVGRDQDMTERALQSFDEMVRRYPESDYARDARLKLDLIQDHLAGKEMEIGRYYETRKQYVGAINRFRNVVENYQTTSHVPEALFRLTETYLALGVRKEAQSAAAVLGYNYPGSIWYERSYALLEDQNLQPAEDSGSWLSNLF
ncbi:MAG TPA: outer membrane protein assembly factor BamD [Geminicoccus sp.]|jgi:outer membrane protein assembly factor BamD|uniref:outer membrane protein assembly factor BamD n=1 Tax=Geminicoccus sp. TaxID=2024832 RepID=UPI002E37FCFA|nr:outer membrane protein assembly factor BamD [Geminicoccus sp.]HEX2527043.1 outer membrane protein assembly factor BamD [Geminicoccus sp.]